MVEPKREKWHEIVKRVEAIGVDGLELNFGCPHGMAERGMGAASGQQPDLVQAQTTWVKEVATTPVIVKLTPNITDITVVARHAVKGGADAISLINTINSLAGVDIHSWNTIPNVGGQEHTAVIADRPSSRLPLAWWRNVPGTVKSACRSPASAASPPGRMSSNSC